MGVGILVSCTYKRKRIVDRKNGSMGKEIVTKIIGKTIQLVLMLGSYSANVCSVLEMGNRRCVRQELSTLTIVSMNKRCVVERSTDCKVQL